MRKYIVTATVLALATGESLSTGAIVTEEQLRQTERRAGKDVDTTEETITRLLEAGAIRADLTTPVQVNASGAVYPTAEKDPLEFVKTAITRNMILTGLNPAERDYVGSLVRGEVPHPSFDAEELTALTNKQLTEALGQYGEEVPRGANKADLVELLGLAMGKSVKGLLVDESDLPIEHAAGTEANPATSGTGSTAGLTPTLPAGALVPDPNNENGGVVKTAEGGVTGTPTGGITMVNADEDPNKGDEPK